MIKLNCLLGAALAAFTLVAAPIARADDEKPVQLLTKPKVGRILRTKTVIKFNMQGMEMVMSTSEKETVKAVKENGDIVVTSVGEGGVMNIGGQNTAMPATPAVTKTTDRFGNSAEGEKEREGGPTSPEVNKLMSAITKILLTDKPVKPNDTWEREIDNPVVKDKKVVIHDVYLGVDTVEGKSYWKVKQTTEAEVDMNGGKVTCDFTDWIDPVDGTSLRLEGSVKNVPMQFGVMSLQVSAIAVRVTAPVQAAPTKPTKPAKSVKKDK
jgi:hypothetical protein